MRVDDVEAGEIGRWYTHVRLSIRFRRHEADVKARSTLVFGRNQLAEFREGSKTGDFRGQVTAKSHAVRLRLAVLANRSQNGNLEVVGQVEHPVAPGCVQALP